LTDSGRFTHKVVKRSSISLTQDRESSPTRTEYRRSNHYATPPTTPYTPYTSIASSVAV